MTKIKAALALTFVLALAGCQRLAPIHNVDSAPVTPTNARGLSAAQVRTAIVTAGTGLGWRIADAGSGRLEGTLSLREHSAVVEIAYSGSSYSIRHKRSSNLHEKDGMIHSNYNGWVQNLDRAIRTEIARL